MRLVSFGERFGRIEGDVVIPMGEDINAYLGGRVPAREGAALPLDSVSLGPPIPCPGKIVCIGLNYRDHASEARQATPDEPVLFGKFSNSVIGPMAAIVLVPESNEVDFEGELAVVIGRQARRVSIEDAVTCVAGYTCANDVSARDLQFRSSQWFRGKAIDTFMPLGPWLVTADEVGNPRGLGITCSVNGKVMQQANTDQMIFGVAEIVSFISRTMTLQPGDVVATGTPAGVGFSRTPPLFLRDGDAVTVTIDRIGSLTNWVRRG